MVRVEINMYTITIAKSIERILRTPLGSRVNRPLFGSLLYTLIDRDFNDSFKVLATKYTYEAIKTNEPRVNVTRVDFIANAVTGAVTLKITLDNQEEIEVGIT